MAIVLASSGSLLLRVVGVTGTYMAIVLASSGSLLLAQITFQSYLLGQAGATGEPYGSILGNCKYSHAPVQRASL